MLPTRKEAHEAALAVQREDVTRKILDQAAEGNYFCAIVSKFMHSKIAEELEI